MQRVLVVDGDRAFGLNCQRVLAGAGYDVQLCHDPQAGLELALAGACDLVLLDPAGPGTDGLELLRRLKAAGAEVEIVIVTARPSLEAAVEAIRLGAADYVAKPISTEQLGAIVQAACQRAVRLPQDAALRRHLEVHQRFEGMVASSRPMEEVFALVQRVAPTDGTVLITGESGTGKEMIVRAIHRLSRRSDRPLMACDCSALAPTLLESELFGHVKGSFSGAIATKQGLFEVAHEGTLFLDEVANLSLETQGKLLRVLETRQVKKVGDTLEHEIDIRLLSASNRDLAEMAKEGVFREDLYYRLNVVPIYLPPLRERPGDIPLLAMTFLDRFCRKMGVAAKGFSSEAMYQMESYPWPGNVRELRNLVERMAILCDGDRIEPWHLPPEVRQTPPQTNVIQVPRTWGEFKRLKRQVSIAAVHELERRFLAAALERTGGNVSRAAAELGMQRTNLHALLRRHKVGSEATGGS